MFVVTGCSSMVDNSSHDFVVVKDGKVAPILVDEADSETVKMVANHFCNDMKLVSGVASEQISALNGSQNVILAGTIGSSKMIDQLITQQKIDVRKVKGQWEAFLITVVENPFPNVHKALVIAGADRRGTAFGLFEVSKRMGVSPWYWWADIHPKKMSSISVKFGNYIEGPADVKYRGIFLNDEDWGLKPWAARKMDTDIKDIGPKTYARIFELLLRLKANFIWPAMHPCTKAFYYYPENGIVADKYAIVVGASHCEPMLRNNVDEWKKNFVKEYGKRPGPWRYDINRDEIYKYWEDRVKQAKNYENVYTVGMRGIHDGAMPGGKNFEDKLRLMDEVIADQRGMLKKHVNKNESKIPQIFCPYKEVLKLYQAGIKLPEDVTVVWPDDNHGYIRNLSTPEEQKRSGGAGIYYHMSYWGSPHDYLWLSSISPALISYEMSKAYAYGNDRLWVFNVGDIKPAELEMEFALELARDVKKWTPEKAMGFVRKWAVREFGEKFADRIVDIKKSYYRLGHECKPEHLLKVKFSQKEMTERLTEYARISTEAEKLYTEMPANRKDAFYQLILYPVKGADLMNQKHLYARMACNEVGEYSAQYAKRAQSAFEKIKQMTEFYNTKMSGGKWDRMMSWRPRGLGVFNMPSISPKRKSIPLDPEKAELKAPMAVKGGVLCGTASKRVEADEGGSAKFVFNSPNKAKKDLFFLARCSDVSHDSWWLKLNDNTAISANNHVTGSDWQWRKVASVELRKGKNILTVSQREPGARIKAISIGKPEQKTSTPTITIAATDCKNSTDGKFAKWQIVDSLGVGGKGLTTMPFTSPTLKDDELDKAPSCKYQFKAEAGSCELQIRCLPTHRIHKGRALRYAVSIDDGPVQIVDVNNSSHSRPWYSNVMRGYSVGKSFHKLKSRKIHKIRLFFLDAGLVVNRLDVNPK